IRGAFEWAMAQSTDPLAFSSIFAGGITTIAVLLFVGATGKSAQIPLFVWLPDAMAGPTPVSALIHAATMVTAGVYMVARASSIYVHAPAAMMIIAIIGGATALFAATVGLAQWDIKKVLAYSTISQLGYMFLACGAGAFVAGIFHVFTHAFFKALLFLGSGSIIIGLHHEQDMRRMGGLKKYMPWTFRTMAAGWLAIAGVPLLSGFFSKDDILYRTFASASLPGAWGEVLWFVGAITALLTAIYMTRLMVLTFWGKERFEAEGHGEAHGEAHTGHGGPVRESPASMVLPLAVLAIGAIFAGYLGVPEGLSGGRITNYFDHILHPVIAQPAAAEHGAAAAHAADHTTELLLTAISSVIAIAGIAIGWSWFRKKPLWQPPRLLEEKYRVDEAYDALIVQPVKVGSTRLLWKIIDVGIIDGAVNAAGATASRLGDAMRYLQTGLARSYVAMVVLGAVIIIGYFVFQLIR
ncbi:MAG TPA: NADH-quinone oxidoreductase subunit L, partial [Blastocatellia bacterium]|nr:NADH-quinone oxidoreductase subunit L [Blastocatellia bacterium]